MASNRTSFLNNESKLDEYEYDVTESLVHYDWAELIPTVIVYCIVLLIGIFGNALIIFTITRYRRLKTITNIFLASLSSADLLLIITCVPVNVAKLFSYTWNFGVFLCKFVHYMQNVSAICSVLTLTAMSIERYYAIVHPMKAQYLCTLSQARKVICGIWIASFVLATPTAWIQVHLSVGERVPAFWCVRDWDSPLSWQIYELYMLVLVLVIPLTIMAGAYARIAREIWRVTFMRSALMNISENTSDYGRRSSSGMNRRMSEFQSQQQTSSFISYIPREVIDGGTASLGNQINSNITAALDPLPDQRNPDDTGNLNQQVPVSCRTTNDGRRISMKRDRGFSIASSTSAPLQQQQRLQVDHRIARQVVKIFFAVVVLFTVCWSPYLIDNVLMSFELLPAARTGSFKHMRIAFHLLSYINSCCNPLLYGFISRNFRRGFVSALKFT